MTLVEWLQNTKHRFANQPIQTATYTSAETFLEGVHRRLGTTTRDDVRGGTNVYDLPQWDVLIVLDACRVDILRQVSREYAWIETDALTSYQTVGGYSLDWLESTFTDGYADDMADTTFVSWNAYTEHVDAVHEGAFRTFEPVHTWGWDNDLGCIPPEPITDTALEYADQNQLIVWYQQPHAPYRTLLDRVERIDESLMGNEDNGRRTVWNLLRNGEISDYGAIIACADNLRWVLDDCERFLQGVDSDVTVQLTADHGELFGETGRYGHPKINYREGQLQVPLVPVDQTAVGEVVEYKGRGERIETPADQLEALGYR